MDLPPRQIWTNWCSPHIELNSKEIPRESSEPRPPRKNKSKFTRAPMPFFADFAPTKPKFLAKEGILPIPPLSSIFAVKS